MFLLKARRLGQSLGESEDQGHNMLGHDPTVDLAAVGEDDVAVHQFGKYQLMDRGRGRMNPAQLLSDPQLLRTERPGNDDLGVTEIGLDSIVTGTLHRFDHWEVLVNARGEPGG